MREWAPNWRALITDEEALELNGRAQPIELSSEKRKLVQPDDLSELSSNERSLFFGIDPKVILAKLQKCGTQISDSVPSIEEIRDSFREPGQKRKPPIFPEGYLVAAKGQEVTHLLLTLKGGCVFFTDDVSTARPLSGALVADFKAPKTLDPVGNSNCELVTINYLYYKAQFLGVLWPTQIAGLLEAGLTIVRPARVSFPRESTSTPPWISSVFVSTSSILIRIPVHGFGELLRDSSPVLISDPTDSLKKPDEHPLGTYLLFRCYEVLAQRYARTLSNTGLRAAKKHDRLLAYLLSEYYRGTGNTQIWGTRFKIAFYLGILESEVAQVTTSLSKIMKGSEKALSLPTNKSRQVYSLTPQICLAYYEEEIKGKKPGKDASATR